MGFEIITGDVFDCLPQLQAGSVQCCVTSPPYFGLRDYGTGTWIGGSTECRHHMGRNTGRAVGKQATSPHSSVDTWQNCGKCGATRVDKQIGLERTVQEYVEKLVLVFREVWRVLRDDGTVWLNLGDSYIGGPGGSGSQGGTGQRAGRTFTARVPRKDGAGLKPKDLCGIPWRVAFALQDDGWYLRCDIIWNKPNPMPEGVTDRPTRSHEYIFLLTKRSRYYYDADAIRLPLADKTYTTFGIEHRAQGGDAMVKSHNWHSTVKRRQPKLDSTGHIAGANKKSVWTVASSPFHQAHFATYAPKLIDPCILAGTSARGCCSAKITKLRMRSDLTAEEQAKVEAYLQRKGL